MACHVEGHHLLQKPLGGLVVREQGVLADVEELALVRVGEALGDLRHVVRSVQAEQLVQPALHGVALGVPDGLLQRDLPKVSAVRRNRGVLRAELVVEGPPGVISAALELLEQLERQRPPGPLVTVHSAAQEHQVRPQEGPDHRERDSSSLVDDQELSLADLGAVLGQDVLHGLPVLPEDVHADDDLVQVGVGALDHVVVDVLLVIHAVQALDHKLEERLQVLGRWARHEDVGVPEGERAGDGEAQGGGLAPTPRRSQRDRGPQSLLRSRVEEGD
mmetsp:Transcript_6623/g.23851  ORF Transcript_6623/g.23851 Transcript_6623/m.23851 type:complete len:275 (+) Transcript_6623:1571-2395(+)